MAENDMKTAKEIETYEEKRARVHNKFIFLDYEVNKASQVLISLRCQADEQHKERSLAAMRMLASGPTRITQPLFRYYEEYDDEDEPQVVMDLAQFVQLPAKAAENGDKNSKQSAEGDEPMEKKLKI